MEQQEPTGAPPSAPNMPADQGLGSLGLIMQLGGSIFLGLMLMITASTLFAARSGDGMLIALVGVAGAVRSGLHRAAGGAILYGPPRSEFNAGPLRALDHYVVFSALQTLLTIGVLYKLGFQEGKELVALMLGLAAWPATLAVIARLPRFRHFQDQVPLPGDRGYEGAGVLMTILGIAGVLLGGIFVSTFLRNTELLKDFTMLMLMACAVLLLVRSIMHANAGLTAVRGAHPNAIADKVARYASWGVLTSLITGVVLFMMGIKAGGFRGGVLPLVGITFYLLLMWPLIIKRFFTEREFAVALEGEAQPHVERAPDMGMTALGWLLLSISVVSLASALPEALFGASGLGSALGRSGGMIPTMALVGEGRSAFLPIVSNGVALWAGLELITMSSRWKVATLVYGVVAAGLTLYAAWPLISGLGELQGMGMAGALEAPLMGTLALGLVLPVASIVLAMRHDQAVPAAWVVHRA